MLNKIRGKLNSFVKESLEARGKGTLAEILTQDMELFPKVKKIDDKNKWVNIDSGFFGTWLLVNYYNFRGYGVSYAGCYGFNGIL